MFPVLRRRRPSRLPKLWRAESSIVWCVSDIRRAILAGCGVVSSAICVSLLGGRARLRGDTHIPERSTALGVYADLVADKEDRAISKSRFGRAARVGKAL